MSTPLERATDVFRSKLGCYHPNDDDFGCGNDTRAILRAALDQDELAAVLHRAAHITVCPPDAWAKADDDTKKHWRRYASAVMDHLLGGVS